MPEHRTGSRETQPQFNIKEALNKPAFLEFLHKFPDAADGIDTSEENIEEIQTRYEAFQLKEKVAKD